MAVTVGIAAMMLDRPGPGDVQRFHGRQFKVSRVVDGDTLEITPPGDNSAPTRVRLWGVDAPEISSPAPMFYGPEALEQLHDQLEGRHVRIVLALERTRDRYGRLLAYVYSLPDGVMVNESLLESGHAYADPRYDHPLRRRFLDLEKRAQKSGRGLWAAVTPEVMPPWRTRLRDARR